MLFFISAVQSPRPELILPLSSCLPLSITSGSRQTEYTQTDVTHTHTHSELSQEHNFYPNKSKWPEIERRKMLIFIKLRVKFFAALLWMYKRVINFKQPLHPFQPHSIPHVRMHTHMHTYSYTKKHVFLKKKSIALYWNNQLHIPSNPTTFSFRVQKQE